MLNRLYVLLLLVATQTIQAQEQTPDYRAILTQAAKYSNTDTSFTPAFTYQPATAPALQELKKTFKLDSIAGSGSQVEQVLNLLHWMHNLVPHDGNHENPTTRNALNMIRICQKESRGLNCRGLATALNECYLALGFPSRFITCLPKDSTDPDCHVINSVYIADLKKWIWIDPTWDAYVLNEKGELLGIEEVRTRLINKQPLILNPDANWNHKLTATKEDYLYRYMAKNLYMLECPVNSEYDTETKTAGKQLQYVKLLPLDYAKQSPRKISSTHQATGATFTFYKTNNSLTFWTKP